MDNWSLYALAHRGNGKGGGDSATEAAVRFLDYDGTVLYSYTPEQFAKLSDMPANPSHKGFEAQGWNYALDSAKEYVSKYGKLDIGQMYITDDGKTRIYISLKEGRLSPQLGIGINGSVVVDWGDGSETDTMTGSDTATTVYQEHIYSAEGDYVIMLDVTGTAKINGDTGSGLILGKVGGDNLTNRTYLASITRIEIGESITIGERAFSSCYSLTSIIIPEGSVDSSDAVFNSCRSLVSITIPEGVTSIGAYAFNDCHSLASVTIPEGVTSIDAYAFFQSSSLASITIPEGVTSIGDNTFYSCHSLASVIIPEGVTSIGGSAFSGCCSLSGITLPESLTNVGGGAFAGCSVLTRLVLPNGVTSINDGGTFTDCYSLTSITLPETLTSIGTRAFYNCYSLSNITIPDGVTSIGADAFYSCYSLASIILPEGVTSIGDRTFYNCYSLRTIELPETLTSIGTNAFYNCWTLTSLTIPESISSFKYAFFANCKSLGFLKFERETPATVTSRIVVMWSDLPTDCIIYVPEESLSDYQSNAKYPDASVYTYVGY